MAFVIKWVAGLLLKRGYTRAASAAGPLIWIILALLIVGFIWWQYAALKREIYREAETKITQQLQAAHDKRLGELTVAVEKFNVDSQKRADVLDANQRNFAVGTSTLLAEIRAGNRKVTQLNAKGECTITPDAAKTWNELQRRLQQSNDSLTSVQPVTVTTPSEASKKWNDLQKRLSSPQ